MKTIAFLLITVLFFFNQANCQVLEERCNATTTNDYIRKKYNLPSDAEFEDWLFKKRQELRFSSRTSDNKYLIPVIFHIVHNGEPVGEGGNLPQAQVLSQLQVLNEDFNRTNPDKDNTPEIFQPLAGKLDIFFTGARLDPEGNRLEEPGIIRYQGNRENYTFFSVIESLMPATMWDPSRFLNIYVINLPYSSLGTAFFPIQSGLEGIEGNVGSTDLSSEMADGIIVNYSAFGSNYTEYGNDFDERPLYNRGRTVTHEVGHWLGLRHIWGDGFSCSTDDYCEDTPSVISDNDGYGMNPDSGLFEHCDFPKNNDLTGQCNDGEDDLPDMFQNFMDYTPDQCMNLFTQCQAERMITVLENSPRRKELADNALLVTGFADEMLQRNLQVFPNPSNGSFFIQGELPLMKELSIEVLDLNGKTLISEKKIEVQDFKSGFEIEMNNVIAGIYLLRVKSKEGSMIKKIMLR